MSLPQGTVINGPYFASGSTVTISGTVNGDVYAAGGNVIVDGLVNGDLLVAGGTITINGKVTQDVRAAGGTIIISGPVNGNLTVGAGEVTLTQNGSIGKSMVAGVGHLALQNKSRIGGNLYYASEQPAGNASRVAQGKIFYKHTQSQKKVAAAKPEVRAWAAGAAVVFRLVNLIALFAIGALLLYAFPVFTKKTVDIAQHRIGASMGIGLLVLCIAPFLLLLLMFTLIGIPFALFGLMGYGLALYVSKIAIIIVMGQWVLQQTKTKAATSMALLIGLVVYYLLSFVPLIGWFIGFVFTLWGLGAFVIAKKQTYLEARKKNLI